MSTTKLLMADGVSEIALGGGAALGYMKAHYADKTAMVADWNKITPSNLKTVQVITDGAVTGAYTDLILESETSILNADGTVDTVWKIREKTENEKLREEIDALKEGQTVQDGAIEDLGAVTSALAGQMEGGQA